MDSVNGTVNGNNNIIDNIHCEYQNYFGGTLKLTKDEKTGIATICIDSSKRRNAISGTMMVQLSDIITELEEWKTGKVVILYGANGFFSSGADLNTVKTQSLDNSEGGRRMALLMHSNLTRLQSLPLISVCVIQGKALGGGAELTTACDFRMMTESAEIGFVHIRLGVTAGWGGGSRLVNILGADKALQVMLSGKLIKADEALEIGYIQHVIRDCNDQNDINSVLPKVYEWLSSYTLYAAKAMRAIKGIVNSARYLPLQDALNKEIDYFASVWGGPAHQQALANNIKHKS